MPIIPLLMTQLEQNRLIYQDLLMEIPREIMKERRLGEKWSIHEHACHMAEVEHLMYDRFLTFKNVEYPVFQPFLQEKARPDIHLMDLDFDKSVQQFMEERQRTVELILEFTEEDWKKEATHPEYKQYNAKILLRHLILHDHFHMYRIEELWLTRDPYLKQP